MNHYVDIVRADGRTERHTLKGGETTLGKATEADISLVDASELEPIHILFAPRGDGCWVSSAKGAQAPAHVNGKPFESGLLGWGTEIDVGSLTLTINNVVVEESSKGRGKNLVLLAMVAAMAAYFLLLEEDDTLPQQVMSAPASLFEDLSKRCPGKLGNINERGRYAQEAAMAMADRYPFHAPDGVAAVQHYLSASYCYSDSGDTDRADGMKREYNRLRERLEEDYQVHRLRLTHALESNRVPDALVEVQALRSLLAHLRTPYTDWLARLERFLKLRMPSDA